MNLIVPKTAVYHRYIKVPRGGINLRIGQTYHQIHGDYNRYGLPEHDILCNDYFII